MNVVSEVANAVLGGVWKLLLGVEFPGVGVSIAGVAVTLIFVRFSIRIVGFLTGFRSGDSVGRAADAAEKAKIEYDRKNRHKIGFE